jgi:hypothetical protein
MNRKPKRRFLTKHAKSSALMVSLVIHCILILVALSYVAVTVIKKEETQFEAVQADRPKMKLQKLQVPVNVKKKKMLKPKLRKRIVVQPKLREKMPDLQMPEMAGIKGGLGSADAGLGGAGSLGFSLPEINIFGLKSRGEKVFLILDCGPGMMADSRGGIPAFNIIKNELLTIVDNLPSTTLFNISVYSKNNTYILFPQMKAATAGNIATAEAWLLPLNQFTKGMGNKEYGPKTLGPGGGGSTKENITEPPLRSAGYWLRSALMAMKQQADAVYVLTEGWGSLNHVEEVFEGNTWSEDKKKKFNEAVAKAKRMFAEENKQRKEKGLPPKVLGNTRSVVNTYVPGTKFPPGNKKKHHYSPDEIEEGMKVIRQKHAKKGSYELRSGVLKKKDKFSFNVIHFTTKANNAPIGQFKKLSNELRGDYLRIEGLDAIRFKSSAAPEAVAESSGPEPALSASSKPVPVAPAESSEPEGSSVAEDVSGDAIIGKWGYGKRKISYEFTAEGLCLQHNRKGKPNWKAPYTMVSANIAQVQKDEGKRFELLADGSLKTHDGQIIKLL